MRKLRFRQLSFQLLSKTYMYAVQFTFIYLLYRHLAMNFCPLKLGSKNMQSIKEPFLEIEVEFRWSNILHPSIRMDRIPCCSSSAWFRFWRDSNGSGLQNGLDKPMPKKLTGRDLRPWIGTNHNLLLSNGQEGQKAYAGNGRHYTICRLSLKRKAFVQPIPILK